MSKFNNKFSKETKKDFKTEKKAVALSYSEEQVAPKLVSKGEGFLAEKISTIAEENNIPIVHDDELANTLYKLEIYETIPEELFEIVAAVYTYIMLKREKH
ncbi:MAG TPA: EscU/YscU/HrcU family type III secretion system export apparatus switch protein [Exilispira sp.]|nr:EscU/YscU/HrcU family type III secretion system export apparatus switch protein [Exilispira sp.]